MISISARSSDAVDNLIRSSDNTGWLLVGGSYLNYGETDNTGATADTENGWLPMISAGVNLLSGNQSKYVDNVYLALEGSAAFGSAHYNGELLSNGAPYQGSTGELIWTVAGRLGKGFSISDNFMFIPFAELGFRYWNRNLGTLVEDYQNFDALGGIQAKYAPTSSLVLSLSGAGGTTFAPSMTVANSTIHFELGSMPMWKVDGKIIIALTKHLQSITGVDYTQFKFGKSNSEINPFVGHFFYEPNSQIGQLAIQTGIAYNF